MLKNHAAPYQLKSAVTQIQVLPIKPTSDPDHQSSAPHRLLDIATSLSYLYLLLIHDILTTHL